ncbi:effector of transcription2 [Abeliophyllum distichum]|uniref:Effector of transcription2 n=1 Tax=Abeliophyllum distichum TaxID=126358 RepID=A0ABD1QVS5_9LAMI
MHSLYNGPKLTVERVDLSMGARLKREDCQRTKHDSAFSHWKILIGPSDWEGYLLGKEGVEKYRTNNLPNCTSSPGVYELGIAISGHQSGQDARKLDPSRIIPVYLGQADNVRTRLQQYGRGGAHLENGCSTDESTNCQIISAHKGPGLFMQIFSKGFSIVYRWAPMKTKRDAERTEAQLLDKFDYAWNKGSNGTRRPKDILKKLDRRSRESQFSLIAKKLQYFPQKQEGIKIKPCEPYLLENGSDMDSTGIFSRIFKLGRSRPRLVPMKSGFSDDCTSICGVATGRGSICTKPPVKGRKRCVEHKGMKVNGVNSKLTTEENTLSVPASIGSGIITNTHRPDAFEHPANKKFSPICGVILGNGSPCGREPVRGNKRCLAHKGRRIRLSASESLTKGT